MIFRFTTKKIILAIIFIPLTILLFGVVLCVNNKCKVLYKDSQPPISTPTNPSLKSFVGNVKTGAQLGEVKQYCKEGLYLVADEGQYLANQSTMLQLRANNESLNQKMIGFAGFEVRVTGKYPAQEVFCQAQICACDDYILVEDISILRYSP